MFQCQSCYSVIGSQREDTNSEPINKFIAACIGFFVNEDENSEKEALLRQLQAQECGYPFNYLFGIAQKVENLLLC